MGEAKSSRAAKPYPPNNLKALRESRGWTQDRAALEFGLSKSGYIKVESGVHKLDVDRIQHAAVVYGVNETDVIRPGIVTKRVLEKYGENPVVGTSGTTPRDVLARVRRRMEKLHLSDADVGRAAGRLSILQDLEHAALSNRVKSIDLATINKLAPVLHSTPTWLFAGTGSEDPLSGQSQYQAQHSERSEKATPADPASVNVSPSVSKLVNALYGGFVEAGTFREVDEFSDLPPPHVSAVRDKDYPYAPLLVFDVRGDSMNALTPHPITEGSQITAVEFESLHGRVVPYPGMIVVVERIRDGGHLRELSVKQLEIYEDRWEYHPRSTNDRHKPIVVPHDTDPDDGTQVRILALVRKIMNDV